jgi:hypothetical protein
MAPIDRLSLDGKAETLLAPTRFFRRELDTCLSPKCCKAQGMAVSAPSDRGNLWISVLTGMALEWSEHLPRITVSWMNPLGRIGARRRAARRV